MRIEFAAMLSAGAVFVSSAALAESDHLAATEYDFDHVSCTGAKNEIRVIITDVKESVGLVTVDLFPNDDEKFLRGSGRLAQVRFAAKSPMTKICLKAPESGAFAMSAYHDENANQKFDKNAFGLPAEPWGLSNNPKVRLAPPPVEKALFTVSADGGAQVHIRLN